MATFNLRALTPGWKASQIQAELSGSPTLLIETSASPNLDANRGNLVPRAHLYLKAGATNLPLSFALDTSSLPDGFHELTAVAYEGSNVRTQRRVTQSVFVRNRTLSAAFATPLSGTAIAVGATLRFSVTANSTNVARIELFSTGGVLGTATGQSAADFAVAGSTLDLGLHGFYAIVTDNDGGQYRTETKWFRIVAPFVVSITGPPPTLVWPATPGQAYDILSATNPAGLFDLEATIAATNPLGQWTETNTAPAQLFYRVRTSP